MPIGSVEIALPAGGDFSVMANGDLQLVADVPTVSPPAATTQRLIRLILSNARNVSQTDGIVSMPDDLFNPEWGASVRAAVGDPINATLTSTIQSRILKALALDPDIAASPAPVVTVQQTGITTVTVSVECSALTGELITIPSLAIRPNSGA